MTRFHSYVYADITIWVYYMENLRTWYMKLLPYHNLTLLEFAVLGVGTG